MDTDLDTFAIALYATTDDLLKTHAERVPARSEVRIGPKLSDAKLMTAAVIHARLGHTSGRRWLPFVRSRGLLVP